MFLTEPHAYISVSVSSESLVILTQCSVLILATSYVSCEEKLDSLEFNAGSLLTFHLSTLLYGREVFQHSFLTTRLLPGLRQSSIMRFNPYAVHEPIRASSAQHMCRL